MKGGKIKMENEIEVNGKKYVLKSSIKTQQKAKPKGNLQHAIVRSYSAGVFAGYVGKIENRQAIVYNARRIWYWDGAASLSQLSQEGTNKPDKCKFPMEVPKVILTDICEVIPTTQKATDSIDSVKIWQQ